MRLRSLTPAALLSLVFALSACSSADDPAVTVTDAGNDTSVEESGPDTSTIDSGIDSTIDSGTDTAEPEDTADSASEAAADADETGGDAGDGSLTSDAPAADSGPCKSGTIEEQDCGKCGKRSRLCDKSAWLDWSACGDETGECVPGAMRDVPCERCGTRKQTCSTTCEWSSGACLDQKGCVAGSSESRYGLCLDPTKVQTRTCTDECSWTAWSECP